MSSKTISDSYQVWVLFGVEAKNSSTEGLPGNSLRTTVDHKTLKILPRGVHLCLRNAASMSELDSSQPSLYT